jgi:DNA polymerase elongation subunit (family B)
MIEQKKLLVDEKDPEKRLEIEKKIARYNNLQLARKIQLNSAYGALGNEFFRFYDTRQAEAITLAGQLSIKWIENKVNAYMNKNLKTVGKDYIVAVDTDSIYLVLDGIVDRVLPNADTLKTIRFMDKLCQNEITPYIQKSYQDLANYTGAFKQAMKMKREALADKAIWTAKKRYIVNVWNDEGVELKEPKMKIMGLEAIKSSTPEICRGKIKDAIKLIINKDNDEVISFIDDFRQSFQSLPSEDVAFPRGVNGVIEYADKDKIFKKGTPIHVRGSLVYNQILKEKKLDKKYQLIKDSDKIKFMYLKTPNPYKSNVLAFPMRMPPEFNAEKYIDYTMQFEKVFLEPLKIILNAIGWESEHTNTLESFFT